MGVFSRSSGILLLLALLRATVSVHAEDHVIEMFDGAFLPQAVSVDVGDSVTWLWRDGTHTVTSGLVDGEAGTPQQPGAFFDAPVDEQRRSFTFRLDAGGEAARLAGTGLAFFDRNNLTQVGFIEIRSGEETRRVGVVDNAFVPRVVSIFAGDSVRWEHEPNEDDHTVTSGISSQPEHRPGELFDADSTAASPVFTYRFATAGEHPYFCRPHEDMGMDGLVLVQEFFVRGDATRDGELSITDSIRTLDHLFLGSPAAPCLDSLDANDDGTLDVSDPVFVLHFLFLGEVGVPPPHPSPGADRTDDALLCLPASP